MSDDPKVLIRRWFEEVWNQGRAEAIDELMAENCLCYGLGGVTEDALRGPAEFRPFHTQFRKAFPNIHVTVDDVIAEGDKVAARCSVRGTQTGDLPNIEATKADVAFTGLAIVRVENGKFVEAWNEFNFMAMYQQLGAI